MKTKNARRSLTSGLIYSALCLAMTACGSNTNPEGGAAASEKDVGAGAEALTLVPAGEASAKLSISQWQIDSGFVRALSPRNEVVAEFYLDSETRVIESHPLRLLACLQLPVPHDRLPGRVQMGPVGAVIGSE
jgi:hypothetical protein